jgi:hypothetical protein
MINSTGVCGVDDPGHATATSFTRPEVYEYCVDFHRRSGTETEARVCILRKDASAAVVVFWKGSTSPPSLRRSAALCTSRTQLWRQWQLVCLSYAAR